MQRRYDNLTSRIAAVDTDLGRALDSEHKLTLEDRRAELAGKRDEVSVRMAQIEKELAAPAMEQKAAAPPVDVAQGEAKAKPAVQVEPVSSQAGKPVESPPSADVAKVETKPRPAIQVEPAAAKPAKPAPAASPDHLIADKLLRLELVRVPAGEFLMGSDPAKDKGAYDDEKPQHRLSLAEFYIGKYPVTNEATFRPALRSTPDPGSPVPRIGEWAAGRSLHFLGDVAQQPLRRRIQLREHPVDLTPKLVLELE